MTPGPPGGNRGTGARADRSERGLVSGVDQLEDPPLVARETAGDREVRVRSAA